MKIYEIGTGYTPIPARISAATEIVVEALAKSLHNLGHDVTLVDIRSPDRPDLGIPVREVPVPDFLSGTDISLGIVHKIKRVTYSLALTGVLKDILRHTDQPVVLHFHNQYNLFFFLHLTSRRLRKRCRIAYTVHSGIWRQEWHRIAATVRSRYFQEAFCMRRADLVFTLNEETKKTIITHLGVQAECVAVVPNGVDTQVYRPLPDSEMQAAKESFGLSNATVLLQVGSVCENKGQLRSVQALLPLLKARQDLIYAYAGGIIEEDYHRQLRHLAEEAGIAHRVRYMGMLAPGQKLNRLYNCASATLLASRYEAFGLVAIESLAAGVPVVVDAASSLDFGPGCIACSWDSLAETLPRLLADQGAPNSDARENAMNHYGWARAAKEYADRMLTHG